MVGYGPEDTHFVVELTYNYGITHYDRGNDFIGLTLQSSESLKRAANVNWPVKEENGQKYVEAPGGYRFYIVDKPQPIDKGMANTPHYKIVKYRSPHQHPPITAAQRVLYNQ